MDDKQLRQRVLDELEFDPSIDTSRISVAVEDGVVTLNGHVGSYYEKSDIERVVRRVKGVTAIAEEIGVRYPSDKKISDDEIAKRAINILQWYAVIPQEAVQVTVQRGLVTLSGKVNWQYQKKAAEDAVRKLSGTIGIVNNITIAPKVEPSDVQKKIEDALRRRTEVEAKAIRINVRDRNKISLDGVVDTWDEREAAENAAWSVAGVQAVDNRLTIVR